MFGVIEYLYSCLGKHLNLMRCGILASSHVAEVEQVAEGGDDRVEEEAQPQKQQELFPPRLQKINIIIHWGVTHMASISLMTLKMANTDYSSTFCFLVSLSCSEFLPFVGNEICSLVTIGTNLSDLLADRFTKEEKLVPD